MSIFDIWDAAEEKEVEIYRLPGMGKVKRNNVLVFHYPYPHKNDSLSMHLLKYYVKRCIALPGDTMGIRSGRYYIKGMDEPIGNVEAQERIARLDGENARGIVMDAYPWDKYITGRYRILVLCTFLQRTDGGDGFYRRETLSELDRVGTERETDLSREESLFRR